MNKNNSIVAVYANHIAVETAIKQLRESGFDMHKLSIIGRDYHSDEHVLGFYNVGERMRTWGKSGAFWGGVWGLLFGAGLFFVPGLGPVFLGGPLVGLIVNALEGAVVVGGLSVVGAGLYCLGIPNDSIVRYESALKIGKFLLIVNGGPVEINLAKDILNHGMQETWEFHE